MPKVVNIPRTQTIIAFGILFGCLWFGRASIDWRELMLMVLTFYFTKETMEARP